MNSVSNQYTTGLLFLTSLFNLIRVRKSVTTKLFDLQRELEQANTDVDVVNGVANLIFEGSVSLHVENIVESNCAHIFVPKVDRALISSPCE
ncbi:hypothetical protein H5410_025954 [Solanum commersonii]|uniref:Uncharacterized protein n=1 Tax=Solanum commersonii TaxID=4109 RepID=A0A9J5Z016_SOLCO|nr:hypothetical protein H5410_025954 [Solanum commersonii]